MKYWFIGSLLVCFACSETAPARNGVDDGRADKVANNGPGEFLGTVHFPTSCAEITRQDFERGIAQLHHMGYSGAHETFARVTEIDPECAMGYWGMAATQIHPLWFTPTADQYKHGKEMIARAKTAKHQNDHEKAYIAALAAYYAADEGRDAHRRGVINAVPLFEAVYTEYPEDLEAASFYSLFLMATATLEDKTYKTQLKAGAIVEEVLTKIPDHPGAHHYIIHAYDVPPLAERALEVARNYGKVAPMDPHALHMPTHIFTRLGLWSESIEWNLRSAEAARVKEIFPPLCHAIDYLTYAYLQTGQDKKIQGLIDELASLQMTMGDGCAYAVPVTPARVALERQRWEAAARLPIASHAGRFPEFEAITHFSRAIGAARSGDPENANQSIAKLKEIHTKVSPVSTYWGQQVEIRRITAEAWLAYSGGKEQEGLSLMQRAADLEAETEKDAVTPGEVLPAAELYGDMLAEAGKYTEAQAAYAVALERSPGRFNSVYGTAFAAERAGEADKAKSFYMNLNALTENKDTDNDRLKHAREFLLANASH